jgi:hypothetical protein
MIVIKNFLPLNEFKAIQNLILNSEFPWRIRNQMTPDDNTFSPYFTYNFYNDFIHGSEYYYNYIIPILKKLNCLAPIQIRANMLINKLFKKGGWHTDYQHNSNTAILYLNTCNGGTELKIKNKIKFIIAEENKIVIFPTKTEHRACSSTDFEKRYIINFNYF